MAENNKKKLKVNDVLIFLLDNLEPIQRKEFFNISIESALNNINKQILKTTNINETMELKQLYNQLKALEHSTYKLTSDHLNEDFDNFILPYTC
jgi:hypothetical protein